MSLESKNFLVDVARGLYPGYILDHVFGQNIVIPAVTPMEDLWGNDATVSEITTASSSFVVVSSSTSDTAAGTGARTVKVFFVDANGALATETATLNGTSTVALSGSYLVPYHMQVLTAGSGGSNAGIIDVKIGATFYARMITGYNVAHHAFRLVPTGYRALIFDVWMTAGKTTPSAAGDGALYVKPVATGLWERRLQFRFGATPFSHTFASPISLPAGTRFKLSANSDTAATVVSGGMTVVYEEL